MTVSGSDTALLEQIEVLLEKWDAHRQPSKERRELELRLREICTVLADGQHLAGLDPSNGKVAALQSLLDQAALVADGSYATVEQAGNRIVEQSEQIAKTRKVVSRLKDDLDGYKQQNRQLTDQIETLHGLEQRAQSLAEERDSLQRQLNEIEAAGDEESKKHVAATAKLSEAKHRIAKLEKQLEYNDDDMDSLKARIDTSTKEAAQTAADLGDREKSLGEATARIKRLEQQLRQETDKRQKAEQHTNEFEQQLRQTRSALEQLENGSKKAIDKARAEGRREATDRSIRPPALWIVLTLAGVASTWLALRAAVGQADGSWMASLFRHAEGGIGLLHFYLNLHFVLLVVLISAASIVWQKLHSDSGNLLHDVGTVLLVAAVLGIVPYAVSPVITGLTDAVGFPGARCLNEFGGTSVSTGWSCHVNAAVGERSSRAEVVAYTEDEVACRLEAAAYLGMDRAALVELSPPLRVRLLPGLPGRARPCVIDSSDPSHLVGFFGSSGASEGACFSSYFYDPDLPYVSAKVEDCELPWRFQTVGSLAAPDVQQARTSSIATAALCTQEFGGEFDLAAWRLVGRLRGEQVECAASRSDGTTHLGTTIGSLDDGIG